jgi:hypothetical protein
MNDRDIERLEIELGKLKPAPPPPALMNRLAVAPAVKPRSRAAQSGSSARAEVWWRWLWPVPALTAAAALLLLVAGHEFKPLGPPQDSATGSAPLSRIKDIEFDRQLVTAFDAIAQMPNGQPVRFRCREWTDDVIVRDPVQGIVIERRTPRLEIVPLRIETY